MLYSLRSLVRPWQWDAPVRGSARSDRKPPSFVGLARNRLAPSDALDLLFSEAMQAGPRWQGFGRRAIQRKH